MAETSHIILVLSNLMDADGTLSDESVARVDLGCKIFKLMGGDYVFFIGWNYRSDSAISIADAMNAYQASRVGIPKDRVLIDRRSRDSVGDAIISRVHLDALFTNYRLSVISSNYHIPRLRRIFERVYGPLVDISFEGAEVRVPHDVFGREAHSLEDFNKTFDGIATGDLSGFVERLVSAHPFYNGERHPALHLDIHAKLY